jgi:hypothetical protein
MKPECGNRMQVPGFDSETLAHVAAAFSRRGKAIRYRGKLSISRDVVGDDEQLDVAYEGSSRFHLRLVAWSTGEWWLLACERAPGRNRGWRFKHELRGQLSNQDPEQIVRAFEDSMLVRYESANEQLARLHALWDVRHEKKTVTSARTPPSPPHTSSAPSSP